MADVVLGVVALLVGVLLSLRGYAALRLVISVWGGFAGFVLGAGAVAGATGESFLASVLAWVVGAVVAALFGVVAYLYYAVSVVIGMGSIGFVLGTTAMVAFGVRWSWVIVLAGVAGAVLLALAAIVGDLPLVILALLGAFAGSATVLAGVMLLVGVLDSADLVVPGTTRTLDPSGWWTAAYVALAMLGFVTQLRSADARRGTLRQSWAA